MHEALATIGSREVLDVQILIPTNGEAVFATRTCDLVTRSRCATILKMFVKFTHRVEFDYIDEL